MTSVRSSDITPALQLATIAGSAFLSGFITSFSWYGIPTVAHAAPPEILTQQWRKMYKIGAATAPTLAILCAGSYGFLSYRTRNVVSASLFSPSLLFGTAAVLVPSIAPWTALLMKPAANDELMGMAERAEKGAKGEAVGSEERIEELLGTWTWMNYVRAATVAVGTAAAVAATLS